MNGILSNMRGQIQKFLPNLHAWSIRHGILALALISLSACSHHLRMQSPDTAAGSRYTCSPGAQCTPATEDVPAELNKRGTQFVALPKQCQGHIHQIVIQDADSDNPKIDVTCAPIEEPIQPME